jgi:hypothetical protein
MALMRSEMERIDAWGCLRLIDAAVEEATSRRRTPPARAASARALDPERAPA